MASPQDDLTHDDITAALDSIAKNHFDRLWDDWVKHESLFVRRDTAAASGQWVTFDPSMVAGSPASPASFIGSTLPAWQISTGTMTIGVDRGRGEQAELPVEKEVGAIKAYRVWDWVLDGDNHPKLSAVVWRTRWTGPVMVADCVPENGTADGAVMKHHGLYAAKDLRTVLLESGYDADVVGEVALFGRVVEHEHGFRAEKAMIRRLVLLDGADLLEHPTLDRDLAERYGCEVSTDIRTLMEDA